jgi:lipid A 3-O-deacylase
MKSSSRHRFKTNVIDSLNSTIENHDIRIKKISALLAAVFLSNILGFMSRPARADLDGVSTVLGTGEDANMIAVGLVWDWNKKWLRAGDWSMTGYFEANVSFWQGKGDGGRSIGGAGFTPVFRYGPNKPKVAPYIEAGVGAHIFSGTQLSNEKRMGTNFEFGDLVGAGLRFGKDHRHEIGYRFQHYSNAGISDNNGGVNFHQLRFRYGF